MKLSNKQIQNVLTGMNRISEEIKAGHLRLEVGTSFAVAIAKKKLVPIYEAFSETREDLLDQFVKKDAAGQKVKTPEKKDSAGNVIAPEQWDLGSNEEAWKKAVTELLLKEETIDRLEPIKLSDFKIKKVKGVDGKEEEGDIDPEILYLLEPWLQLD